MEAEVHSRKALAAEIGREAGEIARTVDDSVELGRHPRHCVDLPGEVGYVERVHHVRCGQLEFDRAVERRCQFVDRGDSVFGVDEQPFPVERDDLHTQRLGGRGDRALRVDPPDRAVRIKQMRARPCHRAKADDDQQRSRPDHQLQRGRMMPVGRVGRAGTGVAVAPREQRDQRQDRDDDQQHQRGREHHEIALLRRDIPRRIEHDRAAPGNKDGDSQQGNRPERATRKQGDRHAAQIGRARRTSHWTLCPMPPVRQDG